MPGESSIEHEVAQGLRKSVWVDAEAFMAETERLERAAELEADTRRRLNAIEQRVRAAESAAEPSTTTWEGFVRVGLTYRQVDHWTARGWLRCDVQHPGSGKLRRWPVTELEHARLMRRMTDVGLEPWAACAAARSMREGNDCDQRYRVPLGHGVYIEVR
jgi:hypothetical protein